jgi:hypothetical protein
MLDNEELPVTNSSPFYVFHFVDSATSPSPIKVLQRVMHELQNFFQLQTKVPEDEETIKVNLKKVGF